MIWQLANNAGNELILVEPPLPPNQSSFTKYWNPSKNVSCRITPGYLMSIPCLLLLSYCRDIQVHDTHSYEITINVVNTLVVRKLSNGIYSTKMGALISIGIISSFYLFLSNLEVSFRFCGDGFPKDSQASKTVYIYRTSIPAEKFYPVNVMHLKALHLFIYIILYTAGVIGTSTDYPPSLSTFHQSIK